MSTYFIGQRRREIAGRKVFCLAVAFVTVFLQSYRAANTNPAEKIKAE